MKHRILSGNTAAIRVGFLTMTAAVAVATLAFTHLVRAKEPPTHPA